MRKTFPLLAATGIVALLAVGCAGPEQKLSRGMTNLMEPLRMGELRRTMEQTALFDSNNTGWGGGFFNGLTRTIARTGLGAYEVVTFPIPSYDPICTDYLAPNPVFPDSYKPALVEDSTFATDTNLGFAGGDVAPSVPGSRFRIFDTH
jgi:putative exosortase-associated protein (TIGR04073 family)